MTKVNIFTKGVKFRQICSHWLHLLPINKDTTKGSNKLPRRMIKSRFVLPENTQLNNAIKPAKDLWPIL